MAGPTDNEHDPPGVCVDIFIDKRKDTHTPLVRFPARVFVPHARHTPVAFLLHSYSGPPFSTSVNGWVPPSKDGPEHMFFQVYNKLPRDFWNIKTFSAIILLRKCALF